MDTQYCDNWLCDAEAAWSIENADGSQLHLCDCCYVAHELGFRRGESEQ